MQFTTYALAAVTVATSVLAASNSTVGLDTLVTDFNKIKSGAEDVYAKAKATDGSDVLKDYAIKDSADKLVTALTDATYDVGNFTGSVTAIETQGAIYQLSLVEATTKKICKRLVALKPAFDKAAFGAVTPIVATEISTLTKAVKKFETALLKIVPSSKTDAANALVDKFTADLKICSDTFKPLFG